MNKWKGCPYVSEGQVVPCWNKKQNRREHAICQGLDYLSGECPCGVTLSRTELIPVFKQQTLEKIQAEQSVWMNKNFPESSPADQIVKIVEELGELGRAEYKSKFGVRTETDHEAAGKDAIGDLIIATLGYCNLKGWSAENILKSVWSDVKKRDWIKYQDTGEPE